MLSVRARAAAGYPSVDAPYTERVAAAITLPDDGLRVHLGGRSRVELTEALQARGILLNQHARTLLADPVFDLPGTAQAVTVVERRVGELGLPHGAPLAGVFRHARRHGLRLLPPTAGPYLRLALPDQPQAPDAILSAGRSPSGALTVAAPPLRTDVDYPKGFYLRVVDDDVWLRGYRCDDEYLHLPEDRFLFEASPH